MNPPDNQPPPPMPTPSASAGRMFSAARKEWGLSVTEVAHSLNLNTTIIRALEQDAYGELPGATFVKGYLRAYANLLKLDYEKVLECARIEPDRMNELPTTKASVKRARHRVWIRKLGALVFRVLLTAGALAGLLWVAVTQLPGLDLHKVLERFNLSVPVSVSGKGGQTEVIAPRASTGANTGANDAPAEGDSAQ